MTLKLHSLLNTGKPAIICFGCSFTNVGPAAEAVEADLDDWPKYLTSHYRKYNIINLAVGASSLQYTILRANKLLKDYPRDKYNYKIIIQITSKRRYTPFKDIEYSKVIDDDLISLSKNYAKTTQYLDGPQIFTLGHINSKFWKNHWWVDKYLRNYSDAYIYQDFFGNILLAEKISDFMFFWHDNHELDTYNLEFDNCVIEEVGGYDIVDKLYKGDEGFHFNTLGAKKVAEWIKQKTQWT